MKYKPETEGFTPWRPSTWPEINVGENQKLLITLNEIIQKNILDEINNVISDANKKLEHRGHVILISFMCAIDSISSYAFSNITGKGCKEKRYIKFINKYFPKNYKPYASDIYNLYRNSSVHSWNIFEVAVSPGEENIIKENGTISFGLLNFNDALKEGVFNFLEDFKSDTNLQKNCLERYSELRKISRP